MQIIPNKPVGSVNMMQ